MQRDYFAILEIEVSASEQEIRAAYRRLALRYHPDLHPERADAEQRLKDLNEAYEVLGNPVQRARYLRARSVRIRADGAGRVSTGQSPRSAPRPSPPPAPSPAPGYRIYGSHVDLSNGRAGWGAYGGVGYGRGYGGPIPQRPLTDDEQALLYVRRLLRVLFGW